MSYEVREGILKHEEGVDFIHANMSLSAMEIGLVNTMSRETILRSYLNEIKKPYDYILIDCRPTLGMLVINSLTAADSVIIDGDAVLFSDESELIYKRNNLQAFTENEASNALNPMKEGPFAKFLKLISDIQAELGEDTSQIRTSLVTARNAPAHERVVRTLRNWNVRIDEVFFLGGISKTEILKAFGAHIFFDDQKIYTEPASSAVPCITTEYEIIT